jgi:putative phage-type endonuclease
MSDDHKFTVETFQTREDWLAARKNSIGGSDAASILGLSKFRSPFATWAHLTGKIGNDPPTLAMKAGLALEPLMQSELEEQGYQVVDPGLCILRSVEQPWRHYSPDRMLYPEGICEFKKSVSAEDWTDEPHSAALVQLQYGLAVTGYKAGVIAALIGLGNTLKVYDQGEELELQSVLLEKVTEFREKYILTDTPPPADYMESTRKALSAMYPRDTGLEIELPAEGWRDELQLLRETQAAIKVAKQVEDEIENKLRAALGEASLARIPGVGKVSWRLQKRKSYVVKESEYRVLRITEEKN